MYNYIEFRVLTDFDLFLIQNFLSALISFKFFTHTSIHYGLTAPYLLALKFIFKGLTYMKVKQNVLVYLLYSAILVETVNIYTLILETKRHIRISPYMYGVKLCAFLLPSFKCRLPLFSEGRGSIYPVLYSTFDKLAHYRPEF